METAPPTVYLLYGNHELGFAEFIERLKEKMGEPENALMNINRLPRESLNLDRLEQIATTLPFLTQRRLIIVEQPTLLMKSNDQRDRFFHLLSNLPPSSALVLIEQIDFRSTRGRIPSKPAQLIQWLEEQPSVFIRRFEAPHGAQLARWIQDRASALGGKFEPQAAQLLAEYVADDVNLAHQEIIKLITYVDGERAVGVTDIEQLTPFYGQSNVFAMVDALGQRDAKGALHNLKRLMDDASPLYIFVMVIRQFRLLLLAKDAMAARRDPAKALNVSSFVAQKIIAQAKNFSLSDLEIIYHQLLKMDVDSKTGRDKTDVALERFITQLAH